MSAPDSSATIYFSAKRFSFYGKWNFGHLEKICWKRAPGHLPIINFSTTTYLRYHPAIFGYTITYTTCTYNAKQSESISSKACLAPIICCIVVVSVVSVAIVPVFPIFYLYNPIAYEIHSYHLILAYRYNLCSDGIIIFCNYSSLKDILYEISWKDKR